jgi:serine/threonine protein kinase
LQPLAVALTLGSRLGPYEIAAQIGQGGMGEVYRALDTHLGRQVAIKILPDTFAHDRERLARFEREARTLASLNHPNIAHIYGFEKANGVPALIMELVDGPTLADRIAEGRIPVDEALLIANQIAEAIETAHEAGIIHRDLKPANVTGTRLTRTFRTESSRRCDCASRRTRGGEVVILPRYVLRSKASSKPHYQPRGARRSSHGFRGCGLRWRWSLACCWRS